MNELTINEQHIQNKIYSIRGKQVMLDSDLAELYGVEAKLLNEQVKRNLDRFPERFRFQLNQKEFDEYEKSLKFQFGTSKNKDKALRSQIATSKGKRGGRRYLPYAFTEHGISMLEGVLNSHIAIFS